MIKLTDNKLSAPYECPYLQGRQAKTSFFFADDVTENELKTLLSCGWRRFGLYYFRPECECCFDCIPVRIPVRSFRMKKGQRRLWRKNSDIEVRFENKAPFDELFKIYLQHSKKRFGNDVLRTEFEANFYNSCPSFYSLYFLDGTLVAAGFLDFSSNALSSVYFIYYPEYLSRALGNYSILREIEIAANLNLDYYYLGYFVRGNSRMLYKIKFEPYEWYDWEKSVWISQEINRINYE